MKKTKPAGPRKKVHLVCQAHLDPVWLWTWEDGLTEALSTFRVACDFCERVRGFVFCHNEAVLYRWVEENDPALFRRIQRLVKTKQWHIAGGSWLQPDLNLTSGESHIRQFLHGKKYFQEKFGAVPTTAYNFDPFGQPDGYAQILAGCGFDSYIFCRPSPRLWPLPVGPFRWRDRSGKEVIARRSDQHYNTRHNAGEKLASTLAHYANEPVSMVLWGIGNHGGGPSREDLRQIERFAREHPEFEIVHSTPEAFFRDARRQVPNMPVVAGEVQNIYPGCYVSMRRVKHAHRACENLMAATERLAAMAWWRGLMLYPEKELDGAWKDILFGEFHDILPGSGAEVVERDALALFGHCTENLRRVRIKAFLSLLRGEKPAADETTPIFVFNPHGFPIREDVECAFVFSNAMLQYGEAEIAVRDGRTRRAVRFQREQPANAFPIDFVVKVAVPLRLRPFEIRRLEATWSRRPKPRPWRAPRTPKGRLVFKGKKLHVTLNMRTGLVDRLALTGSKKSFVRKGALRLSAWPDVSHSWECGDPETAEWRGVYRGIALHWRKPAGVFRLATPAEAAAIVSPPGHEEGKTIAPVRIIEQGPVRTIVEAVFTLGKKSAIVRRYVLSVEQDWLEVRDRIFWNERDAMLKVAVPLDFKATGTISESPYGAVARPVPKRHVEQVNQRWVAATEEGGAKRYVALLNNTSYSHSIRANTLYLGVLRSPPYGCFGLRSEMDAERLRAWPRQDQGEHEVQYRIMVGKGFNETRISRAAQAMNVAPQWIVHHPGRAEKPAVPRQKDAPFITVSPSNVQIAVVKKSERGNGLAVRLWEQAGRKTKARVKLSGMPEAVETVVGAYGLKTLVLHRRSGRLRARETNLIESPSASSPRTP